MIDPPLIELQICDLLPHMVFAGVLSFLSHLALWLVIAGVVLGVLLALGVRSVDR